MRILRFIIERFFGYRFKGNEEERAEDFYHSYDKVINMNKLVNSCGALKLTPRKMSVRMGMKDYTRFIMQSKMKINIPFLLFGIESKGFIVDKNTIFETSDSWYHNEITGKGILYIWENAKFNAYSGLVKRSSTTIAKHKEGKIQLDVLEALFNVLIVEKNGININDLSIMYCCINSDTEDGAVQSLKIFDGTNKEKMLKVGKKIFDKKVIAYNTDTPDSFACWDGKRCKTCPQKEECEKDYTIKSMIEIGDKWKDYTKKGVIDD